MTSPAGSSNLKSPPNPPPTVAALAASPNLLPATSAPPIATMSSSAADECNRRLLGLVMRHIDAWARVEMVAIYTVALSAGVDPPQAVAALSDPPRVPWKEIQAALLRIITRDCPGHRMLLTRVWHRQLNTIYEVRNTFAHWHWQRHQTRSDAIVLTSPAAELARWAVDRKRIVDRLRIGKGMPPPPPKDGRADWVYTEEYLSALVAEAHRACNAASVASGIIRTIQGRERGPAGTLDARDRQEAVKRLAHRFAELKDWSDADPVRLHKVQPTERKLAIATSRRRDRRELHGRLRGLLGMAKRKRLPS